MLVDAIERESCVVHMVVSLSHVLFRVRHFSSFFSVFSSASIQEFNSRRHFFIARLLKQKERSVFFQHK